LVTVPVLALDIVEFQVVGDDADLEESLRESSSLLAAIGEETTDPQDLFAAALAEYGRMVAALYAEGHYSPVVRVLIDGREAATIPPLDVPDSISQVRVIVEPGPLFRFSEAAVTPLTPQTRLPSGFAAGQPAQSGLVQDSVAAAIDGWRDAGHARASTADQSIVADHQRATLSAKVALNPGPRLRFGPLAVVGEERMREARILQIAGLPTGRVFNPRDLERSAERLRRTGVFKSVTLTEDEAITAPDMLGITATLVEEKRRRYSFGAEFGSLDGVALTGMWMHRNLLGGAERLTIEGGVTNIGAQDSGVDYRLGATLARPATFSPDTTLSFSIGVERLDEDDYVGTVGRIGTSLSREFSDNLTGRIGVEYSISEFTDDTGDYDFRLLSLPVGLTRDTRDEPLDATTGTFLDVEMTPFQGFGDTSSGVQVKLDGRAYRGFGTVRPIVLAGRVQAGAVFGADLATTPRDYLFYSGGGGTVRGQPYQSLGVEVLQSGGEPVQTGGTAFVAGSVELRAKVTERIGAVGFVDAGRVSALDVSDSGGWHAGAGLGVRYDTGFGPIRLDIAAPVGGDTGDGVQFYIGFGQAF
jgi:translocation and assembly module TamA